MFKSFSNLLCWFWRSCLRTFHQKILHCNFNTEFEQNFQNNIFGVYSCSSLKRPLNLQKNLRKNLQRFETTFGTPYMNDVWLNLLNNRKTRWGNVYRSGFIRIFRSVHFLPILFKKLVFRLHVFCVFCFFVCSVLNLMSFL